MPYVFRLQRREPRGGRHRPARYVAPVPETPNLTTLKKDELIEVAEEQGVETTGTKADIIERLTDG